MKVYSTTYFDTTIDKLTTHQLEAAAADLRNAALVVKHAGYFKNAMVNRNSGEVCALGAIELATYKRLAFIDAPISAWVSLVVGDDASRYRFENAVIVFADFVPDELCADCYPRDHWDHEHRVVHYNDAHCMSGDLLVNILNIAADRALERSADRRSLLAGRLLASV